MPPNHLVLCHPLLLLPSSFPGIRIFSNKSVLCIRWSKDWNFSFSISPSNEYSELFSFRIDWFDLFAVQRTLKSLLQHHNSNALILLDSTFFMVQLSHPYILKMEESCSDVRSKREVLWSFLSCLNTASRLCLLLSTANQAEFSIRKGVGLWILESLEVWPTPWPLRSLKTHKVKQKAQ